MKPRSEQELRTALETIPAFVWTAEPDGALEFLTENWYQRMRHTPDEVLGGGRSTCPVNAAGRTCGWRVIATQPHLPFNKHR